LGIGTGVKAALRFLVGVGTVVAGIAAVYWAIANRVRFLAPVERLILSLPVLGPALEAVLLSRLCLALRLTLGGGLPVSKSLKLSLDAAASALYTRAFERAKPGLRRGETLTEIMTRCNVFPSDFLDVIANAEEGGQVPEVMERVAKNYQEDAARRLKVLSQLAAWLVYVAVAVMIIRMIFQLAGTYVNALNQFA
jgi:type II secretory pathway component PulF